MTKPEQKAYLAALARAVLPLLRWTIDHGGVPPTVSPATLNLCLSGLCRERVLSEGEWRDLVDQFPECPPVDADQERLRDELRESEVAKLFVDIWNRL